MHAFFLVFLLPFLFAPLVAQGTTDRGIAEAWQTFLRENGPEGWTAEWNSAAGTPSAIYGRGLRLDAGRILEQEDARRHAQAVLDRFATLLGRGRCTFVEDIYGKVRHTHVFVYQQQFQGLNVLDGRADVRIHDVGALAMFGSLAFDIPAGFSTSPKIPAVVARAVARKHLGRETARSTERLLIWADRGGWERCTVRLAWEVKVLDGEAPGRVYVDAGTAEVIEFRGDRHGLGTGLAPMESPVPVAGPRALGTPALPRATNITGTVKAWVNLTIQSAGALSNVAVPGIRVQVQGGGSGLTDASGRFNIPHTGTAPVNVIVTFANGRHVGGFTTQSGTAMQASQQVTPGTPATIQIYQSTAGEFDRAQSTAFYFVDQVNEFVRQSHILGNHSKLAPLDRIAVTVNVPQACNAGYQNNAILFGASWGSQCPNLAVSPVVQHEWGHGLDDVFGGIAETDGLSEGWADTIAVFQTGQPQMGTIRDARNTRQYPSGNSPHEKGETWMGANWKLRQALIQKLGQTAGQTHAETIVLGSILANATTQPAAVREVFLLDDNDANLNNGTPNCRELFAAYTTAHNIPSPVQTCSATPGSWTVFGKGCGGSGQLPPTCASLNPGGGSFVAPPPPGTDLAYAVSSQQAMQISAVKLFTRAVSGASAADTLAIHRDASGAPASTAAATATLTAGSTAAWYKATLQSAVSVAANERVWIVHSGDKFLAALLNSGTAPATASLSRHPFFTSGAWVGIPSQIGDRPAWQIECVGGGKPGAVPALSSSGVPEIGFPFTADLTFAKPNATAMVWVGVSNTKLGTFNLPLDLGPFGASGCSVLTSSDVPVALQTDATGRASWQATIPNSQSLVGLVGYLQAMVLDVQANALGLAWSNAATAKVGTR